MRGYRKLALFVLLVAAAAFVNLNEHQADVLIAISISIGGGAGLSSIGESIGKALGTRTTSRDSGSGGVSK